MATTRSSRKKSPRSKPGAAKKVSKGGKPAARRRTPGTRGSKRVYFFGGSRAEGRLSMRNLLGGKGANLAEMTRLGVPVPAGFTISTEACTDFERLGRRLPAGVKAQVLAAIGRVERIMGGRFGSEEWPLLLSIRSGARVSMPGMMDTVLNLGLNDTTVEGLAAESGDRCFAFDSYRRFIQMYGDVVLGIDRELFEEKLRAKKRACGVSQDTGLDAGDLAQLVKEYQALVLEQTQERFPQRPVDQLWGAIGAVFQSWNTPRAITYRRLNGISDEWGTAVNVQSMVFGNLGDDSATGVAFTRDPATGENRFFGEFLPRAQGEDVVAGIRTPQPITRAARVSGGPESLEELMRKPYRELRRVARLLEDHYRDMQDLEFTIQRGTLWMLQTRSGKRSAHAAVRIAVDMVRQGMIDRETALSRVEPEQLDQLLHPMLDHSAAPAAVGKGLAASPGAASGAVVFTADAAEARGGAGEDVILVRRETSPEDIHGMNAARGFLTALGGTTSHAAVVARGMGRPCVSGCAALEVGRDGTKARIGAFEFAEGDVITLDGSTGDVYRGRVPTLAPEVGKHFATLMRWADEARQIKVRTNADTPEDAALARRLGAEGIGLCRTEHMFFDAERLLAVRRMILAESVEERVAALEEILPMQREDFYGILRAMSGLPVTIRLLDPPLHEFLPHGEAEIEQLARDLGVDEGEVARKVESLREFNPMLGHRGCRLAITFPEIYRVQTRAIIEAACRCAEDGVKTQPEIMVPLIGGVEELRQLRALIDDAATQVMEERGRRIRYSVGTMIEVPRAALTAGRIAEVADFFSFGTNDLTQMTMALSRDDSGRFLSSYIDQGLLPDDPFVSLDVEGVGELIRIGVKAGRKAAPGLKIGICGEHGGDPRSVVFCVRAGLDYVSCSPYRIPIARLAAAQAALGEGAGR